MSHLSDETLTDALLGPADPRALAHLRQCETCAKRLADAEAGLAAARRDVVPEPPPLYWEALRRNVARRVEEPRPPSRIGWLVPLAAAAILSAVVIARTPLRSPAPVASPSVAVALPAWSALPPLEVEDDESALLLEGALVSAGASQWDEGGGADAYLADLTDDESSALAEALAGRASRGKGEDL
jgi:hypothetical protein